MCECVRVTTCVLGIYTLVRVHVHPEGSEVEAGWRARKGQGRVPNVTNSNSCNTCTTCAHCVRAAMGEDVWRGFREGGNNRGLGGRFAACLSVCLSVFTCTKRRIEIYEHKKEYEK